MTLKRYSPLIAVGTKVGYTGKTIEKPWLPRGTEGVVKDIDLMMTAFPYICDFNVPEGDDWPMCAGELEIIR